MDNDQCIWAKMPLPPLEKVDLTLCFSGAKFAAVLFKLLFCISGKDNHPDGMTFAMELVICLYLYLYLYLMMM